MSEITGTVQTQETQPIAITGLPACPPWCAGDCKGGEVEHLGNGLTIQTDRLHERPLTELTVADGDSYADRDKVTIKVFVERYDMANPADDPGEDPSRTRVIVDVDQREPIRRFVRLSMGAADLRQLAAAALEGAELLDAAFSCCDVDPDCVHAQRTAAAIAAIRAEREAR